MLQNTEQLRAFVNFQLHEIVQLWSVLPFFFKKAVKRKCSFVALSLSYYWCVNILIFIINVVWFYFSEKTSSLSTDSVGLRFKFVGYNCKFRFLARTVIIDLLKIFYKSVVVFMIYPSTIASFSPRWFIICYRKLHYGCCLFILHIIKYTIKMLHVPPTNLIPESECF